MHRVSRCAGSGGHLPMSGLPVGPSTSLNGVGTPEYLISQLDGWPACAPVNASPTPLPVRTLTRVGATGCVFPVRLSHPRHLAGFQRRTIRFANDTDATCLSRPP
jgi:hypothetical protein